MNLKNNVTDSDIEALFDHDDNSAFKDESQNDNDELVPQELQVSAKQTKIERPDEYKPNEIHEEQLKQKKENEKLLSQSKNEELLNVRGNVTKELFDKIAKLKEQAALEEYKEKQAKIPVLNPNAPFKLYSDKPQCTFHIYQPKEILPNNKIACACKFCSDYKEFTLQEWKNYQLVNQEYF